MLQIHLKLNKKQLVDKANKFAVHLAPEEINELRGMAQGSGIKYSDMLIYNFFYSLGSSPFACRQFAVWGDKSKSGDLIHSRNLDWFDYPGEPMKKNNLIINYNGTNQQEYLILSWPGFASALTGTNKAGLTMAFNQYPIPGDTSHLSEPTFFTMKRALRTCSTAEEATDLFKKALPMDSGCVLISDARQKKAVVVEIIRGKVGVRTANKSMISCANHPTAEAGIASKIDTAAADSPVCKTAQQITHIFDPQSVKRLMAHPSVLQKKLNLLSVVFIPQQ
ncbi:MAG: hypothetical protein HRT88_21045, partial [Lentisphaeraceae bacterium]|nr:hypothetical protein [Lentisphaeraceae bacterium]